MGSFITHVHVLAGKRKPEEARLATVEALRDWAVADGTSEVATDAADSDRTMLVGPADTWIAVYDEALDMQDQRLLADLAAELSRRLQATAVSALVHDSDVLYVALSRSGETVGAYVNRPLRSGLARTPTLTWSAVDQSAGAGLLGGRTAAHGLRAAVVSASRR